MKRISIKTILVAAAVFAVGTAANAGSVDVLWSSTTGVGLGVGTSAIDAAAGDIITAEIYYTPDAPVTGYGISLEFDTDLNDELNVLGATEFNPGFTFNATVGVSAINDSAPGVAGSVLTYEALGFAPVAPQAFLIGTVQFQVTANVATDGDDVFSGLFNAGVDAVEAGTVFNGAAVNVVPEPGTLALMGFGLASLGFAGRRRV